jgi:hypothetical protein
VRQIRARHECVCVCQRARGRGRITQNDPLRHSIGITHTANRIPEKSVLAVPPSALSSECARPDKLPRLLSVLSQSVISESRSQPVRADWSRMQALTWRSFVSPQIRRQRPKNPAAHCPTEDSRTHFGLNATNSIDHSLNGPL